MSLEDTSILLKSLVFRLHDSAQQIIHNVTERHAIEKSILEGHFNLFGDICRLIYALDVYAVLSSVSGSDIPVLYLATSQSAAAAAAGLVAYDTRHSELLTDMTTSTNIDHTVFESFSVLSVLNVILLHVIMLESCTENTTSEWSESVSECQQCCVQLCMLAVSVSHGNNSGICTSSSIFDTLSSLVQTDSTNTDISHSAHDQCSMFSVITQLTQTLHSALVSAAASPLSERAYILSPILVCAMSVMLL